jgi:type II secretory ATPase GspE/PulE/Tfp pilus assembly ATPase PilB-like protein
MMRAREGGCADCNGTGYKGRLGIHELLVRSDEIRDLVYRRAQAEEIRAVALAQGMRTLKQDGIEKVLGGLTDLRQVRSVCST